ncbi:cytochrome P450 [Annulohypoxylon moriforme]|nr:cytochrome P450 [Annulohypoxylon moriforme]
MSSIEPWIVWLAIAPLLLCLTYLSSSIQFRRSMKIKSNPPQAPVVPYWIPWIAHAISLMDPHGFLIKLTKFSSEKPLLVKATFFRFFVFNNGEQVKSVFRNSKRISSKSTTTFALRNLFNLPEEAINFYWADDSGMSQTPRKGSNISPENRINFLITQSLKKFMSANHLQTLKERYMDIILRDLDKLDINSEWTTLPDLYTFLQNFTVGANIEALAGSKVLEIYPQLTEDLLIFQSHIPDYFSPLPRWFFPGAYKARRRILEGIKRWHEYANKHSDCSKTGPDDPEWEPYFGTKLIRTRQSYALQLKQFTPEARASEDLGLIFTATTNVVVATFWFILRALKDPVLLKQLLKEASECISSDGTKVDMVKLTAQPLLQSTYAEVLRLYITLAVSRIAEYEDIQVAGYTIPKDSFMIIYNRSLALNEEAWIQAGRTLRKPLTEFDAERFLVDPDWTRPEFAKERDAEKTPEKKSTTSSERRFSMDGLLGLWIPYGGGDHICPGRHFAKHEMLLTFVILLTKFDVELTLPSASEVLPDTKFAPYGALPPTCKVPCRIRRRAETQDGDAGVRRT